MTPAEIIEAAKQDQVIINLGEDNKIKLAGPTSAVQKWTPTIAEQKAEIIDLLSKPEDPLPAWCNRQCPHFEEIMGIGPGCVTAYSDYEAWTAFYKLTGCPGKVT